jgi:hypothetical protein
MWTMIIARTHVIKIIFYFSVRNYIIKQYGKYLSSPYVSTLIILFRWMYIWCYYVLLSHCPPKELSRTNFTYCYMLSVFTLNCSAFDSFERPLLKTMRKLNSTECDGKKKRAYSFSKSFTNSWILLLFNYHH